MRQSLPDQIASNVRVELARRGMRHKELADLIGMTPTLLSHRLQGRTPLTLHELGLIADALDIPEGDLLAVTGHSAGNSGHHSVSPAAAGLTPEADADGPTRDQSRRAS